MSVLAIIPARGGSKRIPKKNIKHFLGKPIIEYAISTALKSNLFDEVMVSTDDDEIADVAKICGASVPFMRTNKNADDFATTVDVIIEVIKEYGKIGKDYDYVCCIYPCTPLLKVQKLSESFQLLSNSAHDCVFPIVKFSFPIQRALLVNDSNLVKMVQPENLVVRSQDLDSRYHDAGQFYFLKTNALMEKQKLLTDNTGYIELQEIESQDVDNLIDWQMAEIKYTLNNK